MVILALCAAPMAIEKIRPQITEGIHAINTICVRLSPVAGGTHRSKITKKVHKPPRNHYIEWPVFSDIGLNCKSQGETGRTCTKYKILIGSRVLFFHFIHNLPFSPGDLLESEERFVNLFCNFSPLCVRPHCLSPFGRCLI